MMKKMVIVMLLVVVVMCKSVLAGPSLWQLYPGHADTGQSYITLADSSQATFTLVKEDAGYRHNNRFGIFDQQGHEFQIFTGSDSPVSQITLVFAGGQVWIDGDQSTKTDMNSTFGFYLDNQVNGGSGKFYSDTSKNSDGFDHAVIFDLATDKLVVGMEDLSSGGDQDFNDQVVEMTYAAQVPAPGAILLGMIGTSAVGWLRQRKSL